jgi:replication initiation and membrane attachment protein DnaB
LNRTLLQISSFILLFVSCKSYVPPGAVLTESKREAIENNYFSNPEKDYVYRANIEAYGNTFTGLFIVKKTDENIHRVVLTTDFGFKMLDVEVSQDSFEIHFILEQLNRRAFVKTLEQDFKILLNPAFKVYETFTDGRSDIFKTKFENRNVFVFKNLENNSIEEIKLMQNSKERVSFSFTSENNTFAEKIKVKHSDLDLKINLTPYQN